VNSLAGVQEMRATQRYKLFQPTEMTVNGRTRRVHLLNLSAGGALIFAPDPPLPGAIVQLKCGVHSLRARVAWRADRRFGVAFLAPLAEADVRKIVADQDALVASAGHRMDAPSK